MTPRHAEEEPSIFLIRDGGQEHTTNRLRYPIGAGTDVIGRAETCGIQLIDAKVSREHFAVRYDAGCRGFVAADLDSANGTRINGRCIDGPVQLNEGDLIEIGRSQLMFTTHRIDDHATALLHMKRYGERYRGTMADMDEG